MLDIRESSRYQPKTMTRPSCTFAESVTPVTFCNAPSSRHVDQSGSKTTKQPFSSEPERTPPSLVITSCHQMSASSSRGTTYITWLHEDPLFCGTCVLKHVPEWLNHATTSFVAQMPRWWNHITNPGHISPCSTSGGNPRPERGQSVGCRALNMSLSRSNNVPCNKHKASTQICNLCL